MKKSKLKLHKETLRQLSTESLHRAEGAYGVVTNPALCGYTKWLTACSLNTCVASICNN